MKIYYRNHEFGNAKWKNTDSIISSFNPFIEKNESPDFKGYQILIIHNDNIRISITNDNPKIDTCIDDLSIVLFISSVGVSFQPFLLTYTCAAKHTHTIFVFGIKQDGRTLQKNDWDTLIEWANSISGQKNTIENLINEMPSQVNRLLCNEEKKDKSLLTALNILFQGYLAINNEKKSIAIDAEKSPDAKEVIGVDRLFRNEHIHGVYGTEKINEQQKADGYFWFDECLPDITKPWNDLKIENRGLENFQKIWNLIYTVKNGEEIDPGLSKEFPQIIKKAHDEFVQIFCEDGKKKLKDLNSLRITLNHNRVKNDFINNIANAEQSLPIERRAENTISAWEIIRNPKAAEENPKMNARRATVENALEDWPSIEKEIRSFFNDAILAADLQFTEKGADLKKQIVGPEGCLEQISQFVQEFKEIAVKPESVRMECLKKFMFAADLLHDSLSNMKYSDMDSELFGGYLAEMKNS